MDQASDEGLAVSLDELLLPDLESNYTLVLPARAVLREQAWPVFRVHRDNDATRTARERMCSLAGHDRLHREAALPD
jgi:hypothetical protein